MDNKEIILALIGLVGLVVGYLVKDHGKKMDRQVAALEKVGDTLTDMKVSQQEQGANITAAIEKNKTVCHAESTFTARK